VQSAAELGKEVREVCMTHAELFTLTGFLAVLCVLGAFWLNRDEGEYG
jgi:hypothetical protein